MKNFLILIPIFLLFACTEPLKPVSTEAPDWPRLQVTVHEVLVGELYTQCYSLVPLWKKMLGTIVDGCAWVNFVEGTCQIYVRSDFPDPRVLREENDHCAGRDHTGSSTLADTWDSYKKAMTKDGAVYNYVRADGTPGIIRKQ